MRDYEPYYTEDGSIGLYSYSDKDVYHSKFGALTEAWEKFVLPADIDSLLNKKKELRILDLCYGIGYNTKALMCHVINKYENNLKNKTLINGIKNFVSIHTNKTKRKDNKLLGDIDTIYDDNFLPFIQIDCLDINDELIKLSPLFKTIKTPGEIYEKIIPEVFSCFDAYYKLKKIYERIASYFYPKNRKEINDLLELKFKNMHIEKEYKINEIINYILVNNIQRSFGDNYFTKDIKKILRDRSTSKFFAKSVINYANFNQIFRYKQSSKNILSTFLHNIYYRHISNRYKNINFSLTESMFNINYHTNDARKSIKLLNYKYDCIFLDAFTYKKAPQLWTFEFIAELYNRLSDEGVILTYSNSAQIRNTLLENNFYVGKIYQSKTGKNIGTIASKSKLKIKHPLNNYEIGLCNTTAGIPYHDPNLSFSNKEIIELREYEFRHSNLMSSSKYMKIRGLKSENE